MKKAAVESHKTQMASGGPFLLSFIRATEPLDPVPDLHTTPFAGAENSPITVIGQDQSASYASVGDRRAFVDVDIRNIQVIGSTLYYDLETSDSLGGLSAASSVIGWKPDSFAEMPKLDIVLGSAEATTAVIVLDKGQLSPDSKVDVHGDGTRYRLAVPLAELGDPEKIFLGAQVYRGTTPIDHVAWVVIDLSPGADLNPLNP